MHKTISALVVLAASNAFCQMPPVTPPVERVPFVQLVRYLELTPQQGLDLVRINAELQRFLSQKQLRVVQVRQEIVEETRRETVDPMALGLRYAELEAICREARARDSQTMRSARAILQPPQLEKLKVLEQAVALLPVAGEAAEAHLLGGNAGVGVRLLMPADRLLPGCLAPAQDVIIRPVAAPGPME